MPARLTRPVRRMIAFAVWYLTLIAHRVIIAGDDPDICQQRNGEAIPTESGQKVCVFGSATCLAKDVASGRGGILG